MEEILRLEDVEIVKSNKTILTIDEFVLRQGDRLALIGPNGAGKSTLLKTLCLLEKPSHGKVYFQGNEINFKENLLPFIRQMSAIFQNPVLLGMTVFDNVALGLKFRRLSKWEIIKNTNYWLKRLGIYHLKDQYAKTLSGGEAQRLAIARSLCYNPKVIFLDEPFSALDAPTREKLLAEFKEILDTTGITAVFVTHDFTEIPYIATKAAVLFSGKIKQTGSSDEVLHKPKTAEIAKFVGVENILDGKVLKTCKDSSEIMIGNIKININKPINVKEVKVCIRPENIKINQETGENRLSGTIKKTLSRGSYYKLKIDCGFDLWVLTTEKFSEGAEVKISFDKDDVHIIK